MDFCTLSLTIVDKSGPVSGAAVSVSRVETAAGRQSAYEVTGTSGANGEIRFNVPRNSNVFLHSTDAPDVSGQKLDEVRNIGALFIGAFPLGLVDQIELASEGAPTKATGAEVTAGTNETHYMTPKAAADAGIAGAGSKVYRALLTQSGTSAPVATVLENTLGGTLVWSYVNLGVYRGTLAGAFPDANKVFSPPLAFFSPDLTNAAFMRIDQVDANTVETTCMDGQGDMDEMGASLIAVEIVVYP